MNVIHLLATIQLLGGKYSSKSFCYHNYYTHCVGEWADIRNRVPSLGLMKKHLAGCLKDKFITHFPAKKRDLSNMTRTTEVYICLGIE